MCELASLLFLCVDGNFIDKKKKTLKYQTNYEKHI